jgi:hypothetical protein
MIVLTVVLVVVGATASSVGCCVSRRRSWSVVGVENKAKGDARGRNLRMLSRTDARTWGQNK